MHRIIIKLLILFSFMPLALFGNSEENRARDTLFEGITPSLPPRVVFKGKVASYPREELDAIYHELNQALRFVQSLAPEGEPHFFDRPNIAGGKDNRGFQVILTTEKELEMEGLPQALPILGEAFSSVMYSPGDEKIATSEEFLLILKIDALFYYDSGKRKEDVFFHLVSALAFEFYSSLPSILQNKVDHSLHKARENPIEISEMIWRRGIELLGRLIDHPLVKSHPERLQLQAHLFHARTQLQMYLALKSGRNEGPFEIPLSIEWGEATRQLLGKEFTDRVYHIVLLALYLVQLAPPENTYGSLIRWYGHDRSNLDNQALSLLILDSSDREELGEIPSFVNTPSPDDLEVRSETFTIGNRAANRALHVVILWLDKLLYSQPCQLYSDCLARTTIALASELYGAVQKQLGHAVGRGPIPALSATALSDQLKIVEENGRVVKEGAKFVRRLQRNTEVWDALGPENQKAFLRVAGLYETAGASRIKCSQSFH